MGQADTESVGKKKMGASMIFINSSEDVLLFLRDDKVSIPFPNRWDLLGGTVEPDETPRQCIVRELKEEIDYTLDKPRLFKVSHLDDRVEYTYFAVANFDTKTMPLNEGQRLKWFSKREIESLPPEAIAFGFRAIVLEFLDGQPWHSQQPE
jgi:8-oxo-dGTP diphosphatase